MNHKDVTFKQLRNVTNNVSKQLLADGIGAEKKQARVITEEEGRYSLGEESTRLPFTNKFCFIPYFIFVVCTSV